MFPGCLRVAVVVLLVVTHGVQLGHARLGPGSRHDALAGFRDHTSVTRSLRGMLHVPVPCWALAVPVRMQAACGCSCVVRSWF